jgi:hypothetical protein
MRGSDNSQDEFHLVSDLRSRRFKYGNATNAHVT